VRQVFDLKGIVKAFLYFREIGLIILEVECDASDVCRE
jgi:hypothetical protein